MQFELWIKQFTRHLQLEKGLSTNSVEAYLQDVLKFKDFIEIQLNDQVNSLRDLKKEHLLGFISWLNNLGMSARSQSRIISGVKAFLKFLRLEKIIENDMNEWLESPKIGMKIPEILTESELNALLNITQDMTRNPILDKRNHAIIELLYATGMRVSELIGLTKKQLNFDHALIRIIGKGSKERLVPFHEKAQMAILSYWEELSLKAPSHENSNYCFLNRRGKPLSRNMVYIMINQAAEKVGIKKKLSPHLFRHTFASHLIQAGADIRIVQVLLGHESILTTEIYTHFEVKHLRETLEKCHPIYQSQ